MAPPLTYLVVTKTSRSGNQSRPEWTAVTRSNGKDRSSEEETLARLKLAATTAEEAARWLRNSLVRLRTGHELEFELKSAEEALKIALERITANAPDTTSSQSRPGGDGHEVTDPQS